MLMTTDTELLRRASNGDAEAFDVVYAHSFRCVYAFAARRAEQREDAEALTRRILERSFLELDRYTGEVPFAAWLFGVARQVARGEQQVDRKLAPARVPGPPALAAPR